ncbi:MAG: GNAT family N-acetyltransferase [Lysobacterales bacterium]
MILETDKPGLRLRPWQIADKASLVEQANNRTIWRNLTDTFPSPYTEADADFWIAHANRPTRSQHLAIELQGRAVGAIGVIAGEGVHQRTGKFGYWLGEAFWGQGIVTATGRALVAHVRSGGDFARLEAPVFAWNPASMRVLEKLGFEREGLLRDSVWKDGELIDSVLYALLIPGKR